ncbi:MAG: DUF3102 domain-containing protein [Pseudohongiella sp.]|nr:DUF3102 domain-containing protein [Pseudohongiella sp.]
MATATKEKRTPGRPKETKALEMTGPVMVASSSRDSLFLAEEEHNIQEAVYGHNLAVINKTYGEDLPYDKTRIENEARFYLKQSASSMIELGKRLVVLKANTEHGEFGNCLERIGIAPRTAQRLIQASSKLNDPKMTPLALLGRSKILELMVEDDDDLEALAGGGTIAGLKLDDIDKMTTRELAAALRKERQRRKEEDEINQRLLESKDQKLNQLEKALTERQRRVKTWEGVVSEIGLNITTMTGGAIQQISHLRAQIEQIQDEMNRFDLSKQEMEAIVKPFSDHIILLAECVSELQQEFGLNLSVYMPVSSGGFIEHSED